MSIEMDILFILCIHVKKSSCSVIKWFTRAVAVRLPRIADARRRVLSREHLHQPPNHYGLNNDPAFP